MDNYIFNSHLFKEHIISSQQQIEFSSVNAYFQNGVKERKIKHITNLLRESLFQGMLIWQSKITVDLWVYSIQCSLDADNSIPKDCLLSTNKIFNNTKLNFDFTYLHPFGCPTFLLDSSLANSRKIPRWQPRSKLGIYLDNSQYYAGSISNVINIDTRYISPKYHLVYDDNFSTVNKLTTYTLPKD